VSGSYDKTIKIWDRRSGTLVADFTGGHILGALHLTRRRSYRVGKTVYVFFTTVSSLLFLMDILYSGYPLGFRPQDRYEFYLFVVKSLWYACTMC